MSNVIFIRQQSDGNPPTYDSLFNKDNSTIARDYRQLQTSTNDFYTARDPQIRTTQVQNYRPHQISNFASYQLYDEREATFSLRTRTPREKCCQCCTILFCILFIVGMLIFSITFPLVKK